MKLNKDSTIQEIVQFLQEKEAPINSKMFDNIAKVYTKGRYTAEDLRQLVHGTAPRLHPCTANQVMGPLDKYQKEEILQYHIAEPPTLLARHYKTSYQNVRLAQQGKFTRLPRQPVATDRPFGPLSIEEKEHIRDNCAHERPCDLANIYNTSMSNIVVAQQGRFVGRKPRSLPRTQILKQAAQLLGVDLAVLEALAATTHNKA
jgi:hypothetical protein